MSLKTKRTKSSAWSRKNSQAVIANLAHPDLVDIDSGLDFDAFIGNISGTILSYENTGSRTNSNLVRFSEYLQLGGEISFTRLETILL